MLTRGACLLGACLSATTALAGDAPSIKTLSIAKDRTHLYVTFASPRPEPSVISKLQWVINAFPPAGPSTPLTAVSTQPLRNYFNTGTCLVTVSPGVPSDTPIDVAARVGDTVVTYRPGKPPDPKPFLEATDDPDAADLYFKGVVAPGHTTTVNSVDLKLAFAWHFSRVDLKPSLVYKHDGSDDKDPDVLSSRLSLVHYGTVSWIVDTPVIESDAEAKTVNIGGGATGIWSHHFDGRRTDPKTNVRVLSWAFEPEVSAGLESGGNTKNLYANNLGEKGGSGAYLRAVPRIAAFVSVPGIGPIQKVIVSAEYLVRILARDELFLETRDLPDDVSIKPALDRHARSHTQASVKLMVTEWFGLEAGYEHGTLPPAFKFVNHKATVSLVFMAAQGPR